ncbi:MAG: exodeoxyribonuclease VII small subunit [Syntrophomonadaceae bacterium]|jgi:exodeoxyribonuclease VII small subunit|nr:exodeoxyribonuclease VII small subunit [Bacillota bacterium]NLM88827.1 exodeoxyribonuclease VII small subunit [Syntrophomonadaceae bacterium]HAA08840.1 exodeoxyribonuclease VII small subunit [Syntrophomonas sp.]HQA49178.1 exodeoxyribonuclease VII small subunit [Syntrophomonadaceae bacterium]HQD89791.1 exodeoxyribonuclease VII small subunit [Syntrophomonadaceae bacterium]
MEPIKFEEALKRLEELVGQLEDGDLELEEAIRLFEEGVKLSLYCQQQLKAADSKVQKLVQTLEGDLVLEDCPELLEG